jgi:hypothetical protein
MIALIANHDWTSVPSVPILSQGGNASSACAAERTLVDKHDDSPDQRFWTPYDHAKVEQEARAMRRAHIYGATRQLWQHGLKRLTVAFANAGSQPPKVQRTRAAGI